MFNEISKNKYANESEKIFKASIRENASTRFSTILDEVLIGRGYSELEGWDLNVMSCPGRSLISARASRLKITSTRRISVT